MSQLGRTQESQAASEEKLKAYACELEQKLEARTRELAEARGHLSEALEQQTATSEVLRIISSSPGKLESVFEAMLENATRICEAKFDMLYLWEGEDDSESPHCTVRRLGWRRSAVAELLSVLRLHPFSRESR